MKNENRYRNKRLYVCVTDEEKYVIKEKMKQLGMDNMGSKTELAKDPMFENAAAGDFRLKAGSPAIGTGDGGVNRGAYAVYPKTDVGCNQNLGLIEDVNVSFDKLNSSVNPGDVIDLELNLNKAAAETMSFEVKPVAGDARPDKDFSFIDNPAVTFKAGETSKIVRVKILEGYDLDQLLVFRIEPSGTTKLEAVGASDELICWRNVDLCKDNEIDVFDLCSMKNMLIKK